MEFMTYRSSKILNQVSNAFPENLKIVNIFLFLPVTFTSYEHFFFLYLNL